MGFDTSWWDSLKLDERIAEGNRNEVWRGSIKGAVVAARRSRRAAQSLDWELDLINTLHNAGFRVPTVIETVDGRRHVDGVVVQHWLDGCAPESAQDWQQVATTLQRLHRHTKNYAQRPGSCAVSELTRTSVSGDADMRALPDDVASDVLAVFSLVMHLPVSVIHGDPMASNIRINTSGEVGLLDFDESRVDVAWHDLSNLGAQILDDVSHARALQLSDAWEAANGWIVEPDYARKRLESLRLSLC